MKLKFEMHPKKILNWEMRMRLPARMRNSIIWLRRQVIIVAFNGKLFLIILTINKYKVHAATKWITTPIRSRLKV